MTLNLIDRMSGPYNIYLSPDRKHYDVSCRFNNLNTFYILYVYLGGFRSELTFNVLCINIITLIKISHNFYCSLINLQTLNLSEFDVLKAILYCNCLILFKYFLVCFK